MMPTATSTAAYENELGHAYHDTSCFPITIDCEQKIHNFNLDRRKTSNAAAAEAAESAPWCEYPGRPLLHPAAAAGDRLLALVNCELGRGTQIKHVVP